MTHEVPVQLLELCHQVWIESCDLDARIAKTELATTADGVVRVKCADHDTADPSFNDSFCAWDFRTVPCGAGLECGEEGRARQSLGSELAFKQRELGVVARREFASEGLTHGYAVSCDDCSYFG